MTQLPNHPAADLFPMMDQAELDRLAEDIKKNGLLEPVVIHDGMILDGRNRLVACSLAGIDPRFENPNGAITSPVLYVLSKNLHRRHLTVSQRGAIAAEAVPLFEAEAHKRELAGRTLGSIDPRGKSTELAAKELGVGETTVRRALTVKQHDPALFEKLKAGEVSAWGAREQLPTQIRPAKDKFAKNSGKYLRQTGEAQKEKMITALSTMTGLCRGLDELNVEIALSVCGDDDRRLWANRSRELANKLRKFAVRLEGSHDAESA